MVQSMSLESPFENLEFIMTTKPLTKPEKISDRLVLKHLIANMPGHVYWKDTNGVYLGCNDSQAQSLGLACGNDVIGKTDDDLPWPKGCADVFKKNDQKVIKTGKTLLTDEPATFNGKRISLLSHKIALKNDADEIISVLGLSIDASCYY